MCGWRVTVCDPSLTRAIPERLRDEFLTVKRYTNLRLLYLGIYSDEKERSCRSKTAFRSMGLKVRSHQVSQRNATQRDATHSVRTLSAYYSMCLIIAAPRKMRMFTLNMRCVASRCVALPCGIRCERTLNLEVI